MVSFGTSYHDTRKKTIDAIEEAISEEFKDYELRRAYTSRIILGILDKRDGIEIDNVTEAMEKLVQEGYEKVLVQPTHVMSGDEYDGMMEDIKPFESDFLNISYGAPLLTGELDYECLVEILAEDTKEYNVPGTEILLMGHGSEHSANVVYRNLAEVFRRKGYENYHVGTVEAKPDYKDMEYEIKQTASRRVILQPLMIVAGDHANNDMAGADEDSWKCRLEAAGYEVICCVKGMGELEGVRQLFVEHARDAEVVYNRKRD